MDPSLVRLTVRSWSDAQLRRAWRISEETVRDPARTAATSELRDALLGEWERRHPGEVLAWGRGEQPPL